MSTLSNSGRDHQFSEFQLECGIVLPSVNIKYHTFGSLNSQRNNIIVVCHAFSGNSDVQSWWGSILGPEKPLNTNKYFIVCANALGSCYGTTGPSSVNPRTGKRYGTSFPPVTIRDSVGLQMRLLREGLGVEEVLCVVGGSLGGMMALEWALIGGEGEEHRERKERGRERGTGRVRVRGCVAVGCGHEHSPWQLALSQAQRTTITADAKWREGDINWEDPPVDGLSAAREIALLSYRNPQTYQRKFRRRRMEGQGEGGVEGGEGRRREGDWEVVSYLKYQALKFCSRFDALSYLSLTSKMDSHDLTRDRGGEGGMGGRGGDGRETLRVALSVLSSPSVDGNMDKYSHCRVCPVGISSDLLSPPSEAHLIASLLPSGQGHWREKDGNIGVDMGLRMIESEEGHDAFLIENKGAEQVGDIIQEVLSELERS